MQSSPITCSRCKAIVPAEFCNAGVLSPCPSCRVPLQVEVFPALFRTQTIAEAQPVLVEGESSCFFHPQKQASVVCQSCGRFLCALCDLEMNGEHLCPTCLETGQKKGKLKNLENTRVLYDRMALSAATWPVLLFWTSLIGAPLALYLVLRHRKEPCGILGRSNIRFVLAGILASLQIIGWILFITYLITS